MAFHVNSIKKQKSNGKGFRANATLLSATPYFLLLMILVLLPFIFIILYAFMSKSASKIYLTLDNFSKFVTNGNFVAAAGKSLLFAFVTTVICLILAYPIAYFIGRSKAKVRSLLVTLITVPMWINMLLRILAWQQIFGMISSWTGITLLGTDFAIIFGMVYIFLPFMIIPMYTSIMKIDPAFYEASKDLGADSAETFFKVSLPLSMPGIISGITMVFLPAATSIIIPQELGDGNSKYILIGNLIESYFYKGDDYYFGSAIAVVLSLTLLLSIYLVNKLDRTNVKDRSFVKKYAKFGYEKALEGGNR